MADEFVFDPRHRLGARLGTLTPEQLTGLIEGVCRAVSARTEGFHGGVNVANISLDDAGAVGLGDELGDGTDLHYTPEQIEYLAPEVFWKNERSPQADVYSVGLLLYTWANGGCLPFLYPDPPASDRAEALRRRMSGEDFPIPEIAESLSVIIAKATAFRPSDRYENCAALLDAFQVFAEETAANGAAIAAAQEKQRQKQAEEEDLMAGILAAAEAATLPQSGSTPRPQRPVPPPAEPEPEKEKKHFNARPLIIVILLVAILLVATVAMQFTNLRGEQDSAESPDMNTPSMPPVTDLPSPDAPDISDDPNALETDDPEVSPSAEPDTTPTPAPVQSEHTYTLYKEDVSWNRAADNCINLGGNLVVINDEAEFKTVTDLADSYGVTFVWVGGFRKDGQIAWVNGETSDYYPWAAGEPSYRDADGTAENFLLLWKQNGTWVYNDSRDNPAADFPAAYSGKIAYICEMD
ncbi:MAG: hypothetical protein MSH16_05290 [Oscillospiraceae bacterium]|nr:hypothetical protein [Oscillospiraceae bacterium]MDY4104573.1 lectin-like protein [Oscillospiraceae bacterium]